MAKEFLPNHREAVFLAILRGSEKYGLEIRDEYKRLTRELLPLGSLYTTLDRMIEKGFLESWLGESSHERGGNRRRYFKVTAQGTRALMAYQLRAQAFAGWANA